MLSKIMKNRVRKDKLKPLPLEVRFNRLLELVRFREDLAERVENNKNLVLSSQSGKKMLLIAVSEAVRVLETKVKRDYKATLSQLEYRRPVTKPEFEVDRRYNDRRRAQIMRIVEEYFNYER